MSIMPTSEDIAQEVAWNQAGKMYSTRIADLEREITAYQIAKDNEDLRNEASHLLMEMHPKATAWRMAREACESQPHW